MERHKSNAGATGIATEAEVAPFALLSFLDPASNSVVREKLDIHIFYDVSVLEIFVNNRVAITTRVYPDTGKCFGVRPWAGEEENVVLRQCRLWELGKDE